MFWWGVGAGVLATGAVGFGWFVWWISKMMDGF